MTSAILAFFSVSQVSADWGNTSTSPFIAQYRKTTLFSVGKLDDASATYSLPYIAPNSITATGSTAYVGSIYFKVVTSPVEGDPAYDAEIIPYDFYAVNPTKYKDYGLSFDRRAGGSEVSDSAYYKQFGVSKNAILDVVGDKLRINSKYFCLYGQNHSTNGDGPETTNFFGFGVGLNLSDLPSNYWGNYRQWTEFATVPEQPYTFLRYPLVVAHNAVAVDYECPDTYYPSPNSGGGTKYPAFDEPFPDAEDDDAFNVCKSANFYTGWEKSSSDWGNLTLSENTSSGTTSIGLWEGFLNVFRETKTRSNKYADLIYSGSAGRYDQIVIERLGFNFDSQADLILGDPYGGTNGLTTARGPEAIIQLRSVSSGTLMPIEGVEVRTQGLYASGTYGSVDFYDSAGKLMYNAPMIPGEISGDPYLFAYFPAESTNKPTKAIWKKFNSISFLTIRPVKGTTKVSKNYCSSNGAKCSFRSLDGGRSGVLCADTIEFTTDPFGSLAFVPGSPICSLSTAGTCKPTVLTGSYLGTEGVKTSLILGGQGAYYVNASGALEYDPTKRKISGYKTENQNFVCDTSELSWYDKPGAYFECVWNKLVTPASDAVNTPTKITNETLNTVGKAGSGSNSIRSFFRTDPGAGEGEKSAPIVSIVDGKSFYDMPSGLGRLFLTAFIVVIGMIVLGIVAMLIFNRGK